MNNTDPLIQYPCAFPIKIMGYTQADFAQTILQLVIRHAPDFEPASMEMRPSKKGKYLSLTCTVNAVSQEQIDRLYQALCEHPMVVMVL